MGRAYYRFGQDVALRLSNGQASALLDAELGAVFREGETPVCTLRGVFSAKTYQGLVARDIVASDPALKALDQPVAVQLGLNEALAMTVGKDASTLNQVGRRLSQNNLTDALARRLLMLEEWQLMWAASSGEAVPAPGSESRVVDSAQEAAITEMVTDVASELWLAAEEAGAAMQPPSLSSPLSLLEAVTLFLEEEWGSEAVAESEELFRTIYDGQSRNWMCYTRMLQELDQVLFYSVCPVSVPASVLPTMMQYLCQVNADLSLGNFELNFSHNTVRFRTSVDVTDVGLAPLLFRILVYQNLTVMDLYLPEMLGIIVRGNRQCLPDRLFWSLDFPFTIFCSLWLSRSYTMVVSATVRIKQTTKQTKRLFEKVQRCDCHSERSEESLWGIRCGREIPRRSAPRNDTSQTASKQITRYSTRVADSLDEQTRRDV